MPTHLPKLFRIRMQDAVDVVGKGDSLLDTLETLQDEGAIRSFDFIVEIKVDKDKALAIESFFFKKSFTQPASIRRKRGQEDYD